MAWKALTLLIPALCCGDSAVLADCADAAAAAAAAA
jgi:hypothetical protein